MSNVLSAIYDRLANEPVLIGTFIIAAGNLFGYDTSGFAEVATTVVLFVLGLVVRHFVSPTRSL
jgi:hypothetical protein